MKELGILILVFLVLLAAVFSCNSLMEWMVCNSKTAEIGYPSKYDLVAGCLIQVEDNRWIPLESYYYREN